MILQVESRTDSRGEAEPLAFLLGERRIEVVEVIDRWPTPQTTYFKVRAQDGDIYILRHDTTPGCWRLTMFTACGD
jgi:hypothetical protein